MSNLFVRKITKTKWKNQLSDDNSIQTIISADAVTSCLRTDKDTLSIWNVKDEKDAVLALAAVNTSISVIDIVIFEKNFFDSNNIVITNKKASNPVRDLEELHYDIECLDYEKLGILANYIANNTIENKEFIKRFTVGEIKDILKKAVEEDRIDVNDLDSNLKSKII